MAKLTIQRQGGFISFSRSAFKILIDGNHVETIKENQTREIEVTNAIHHLQVVGKWLAKSKEISIDFNSSKTFLISINPIIDWIRTVLICILFFGMMSVMNGSYPPVSITLFWVTIVASSLALIYLSTLGKRMIVRVKEARES